MASTGSMVESALRIPDYELVQLVGRGSYGEVWMAHNALGSLRAVKIVWRKNFEDDRPYEREFRGIRKFEPVSRKHDGLIDLYHVGRNNDDGYFYYAMELADDAAPIIADGGYRPRTLREELRTRGHLTIEKAIEIGIKLASALEHLHRAGLVHRDIKPSNIIFVDGNPKLADIGLVAGISDARSFVGTEGFVPPEGPGSPPADIFSLGKVLYETSTGLDRNEFPRVPSLGGGSQIDPREFSELNEVLLKACDPSPHSRYRTAEELLSDLRWIRDGKSLCRLRSRQRRTALFWKSLAAAAVIVLSAVGFHRTISSVQHLATQAAPSKAGALPMEMQRVEELFQRDEADGALACLARLVRADPANRAAAERLMAALTWRNFVLPSLEPMALGSRPSVTRFSGDGEEIIAASFDGTIQFWNATSGELSWKVKPFEGEMTALDLSPDRAHFVVTDLRGGWVYDALSRQLVVQGLVHDSRIVSAQFSPDQNWILTGAASGTAHVWDFRTAEPIGKTFPHEGPIRRAMFSPDGRYVITIGAGDGATRIWDFGKGEPTSSLLRQGRPINNVVFSRNSFLLATTSDDMAQVWRVPDGALVARLPHHSHVTDVTFSPDSAKLATASEEGTAMMWDLGARKSIGSPMRHRARVRALHYSPDGMKLVTISDDRSIRLWDATTGQSMSEPTRHSHSVEAAAFSPAGDRLVTAVSSTTESSLWIWKTTARNALNRTFAVTSNKRTAHLIPQSGELCIGSGHSLRIWAEVESQVEPLVLDLAIPVDFFNLSMDGTRSVVVSGHQAWVWDLPSRQSIKGPLSHTAEILSAQFSPDHRHLAVATAGGHLVVWQIDDADGPPNHQVLIPQPGMMEPTRDDGAFTVEFSADGHWLVAACRNGKGRLFNAQTGQLIFELPHKHWVVSAKFSADGRRIVTTSYDRYAQVWDTATGQPVGQPLHHDNDVLTACFSPDGRRVLTASRDWTARVWDAQTGQPVSEPLQHSGPVLSACFSPDGIRVATGSVDETARLWDAESGQPLTDPFRHSGPVQQVEFTADGSRLLVVPAAGPVQLIDVLQVQLPAPDWLPDLAEAVARQRLNERQVTEPVSAEQLFRLKHRLNSLADSGPNVHWAKWFMADPAQRTISPDSTVGLSSYLDELLRSGTRAALRQAIRLEPTDALAHVRLAQLLVSADQKPSWRDIAEAQWHSRYARKLQPESKEISVLCETVASRIVAQSSSPGSK